MSLLEVHDIHAARGELAQRDEVVTTIQAHPCNAATAAAAGFKVVTLPLGVMNFSTEYSSDKARVMAYTVITIIPAIIFYAFAERHIVSGLTSGSVKG